MIDKCWLLRSTDVGQWDFHAQGMLYCLGLDQKDCQNIWLRHSELARTGKVPITQVAGNNDITPIVASAGDTEDGHTMNVCCSSGIVTAC